MSCKIKTGNKKKAKLFNFKKNSDSNIPYGPFVYILERFISIIERYKLVNYQKSRYQKLIKTITKLSHGYNDLIRMSS